MMIRKILASLAIGLVLSLVVLSGCNKSAPIAAEKSAAPSAEVPPPTAEKPLDVIMTKKTVADALAYASPRMTDEFNKSSDGTLLFAFWAIKNLSWADVAVAKDETTFARVLKDVDVERAKRLCVSGTIVEIETQKVAIGKAYEGLLTAATNLFHFAAVRSSGDLVERSHARICGFVTGKYDYKNSGGGVGHGVDIVGVFDLPENKATK